MIDLHCHILHSLDDGPKTVNESIQIAQALVRAGYRLVAATPHMVPGTAWMPSIEEITTQVAYLNQAMRLANLNLEIVSGMEIALDPQIPDLLAAGSLLPLGSSSCLLIESPFQQLPPGWQKVIFAILATGHQILLAHPERCPHLSARPDLIEELVHAGVCLQVNWGSFLGHYGLAAKRTANFLAWNGWIHCLATDSHHSRSPHYDQIQMAASKLGAVIGQDNLRQLTTENPNNLLRGQAMRPMTITGKMTGKMKKRWWQWW
jgi:protein-tyrosine phosphatase